MVEGDGFEPSKAVPADLQSDPFGHSGTPPGCFSIPNRNKLKKCFPNTLLKCGAHDSKLVKAVKRFSYNFTLNDVFLGKDGENQPQRLNNQRLCLHIISRSLHSLTFLIRITRYNISSLFMQNLNHEK